MSMFCNLTAFKYFESLYLHFQVVGHDVGNFQYL